MKQSLITLTKTKLIEKLKKVMSWSTISDAQSKLRKFSSSSCKDLMAFLIDVSIAVPCIVYMKECFKVLSE
jgi:hypothetical protein